MSYERAVFSRYLTPAEEGQLFRYIKQFSDPLARRDYAWMRLLRFTGMRVGTLSQLTCGEAREMIASQRLLVADGKAKGKRGYQTEHLHKRAKLALQTLLKLRRECGHRETSDAPLVMSRQANTGLSLRSFQARMQHWVTAAQLQVVATPHWFRHTLAQRVLLVSESADPLGVVQHLLGHASRDSTVIYTRPSREDIVRDLDAA